MDALVAYADGDDAVSSSSASSSAPAAPPPPAPRRVELAPEVSEQLTAADEGDAAAAAAAQWAGDRPVDPSTTAVRVNPTYTALYAPLQGPPVRPPAGARGGGTMRRDALVDGVRNVHTGYAEEHILPDAVFEQQMNGFQSTLRAEAPGGGGAAVAQARRELSTLGGRSRGNEGLGALMPSEKNSDGVVALTKLKTRKSRKGAEDGGGAAAGAASSPKRARAEPPVEDRRMNLPVPLDRRHEELAVTPSSVFHGGGGGARDKSGRSFIDAPHGARRFDELETYTSYIPKRCVHVWSGHTKGVSTVRFFPQYGHLLLSAGMDADVRLWDVHSHRRCVRTYSGHARSVRDVAFDADGRRFLSASYDRTVKLWDTETGQCIRAFSNRAIAYCATFRAAESAAAQHEFLAGCSDKKVVQYDVRSGEIVQEYSQHLGAVNTLTFVDDGRRFVSSSDDKTLRVWEYGIPVVIKYVSDPAMHSMPAAAAHPNGKWVCFQSLDNHVVTYGTRDHFKLNRRKDFRGHLVAGYACQLAFAPDGRFLASGDSIGRLFFWDWRTSRVYRSLKAHDGVAIGVAWHPTEPSKVASCGWDGLIKYWD